MDLNQLAVSTPTELPLPAARLEELRSSATALEASFLSEMLRHTGIGTPRQVTGGGPGEEAFAGFLADAYGTALAARGGIGLSEQIFDVLVTREVAAARGGAGSSEGDGGEAAK